jgi:hypothetical protein
MSRLGYAGTPIAGLGVVYTCDFAYAWVYNLLPKVFHKLIYFIVLLKCVDILLLWVSDQELDPYLVCEQIVHGIVRRFVHGFVHV